MTTGKPIFAMKGTSSSTPRDHLPFKYMPKIQKGAAASNDAAPFDPNSYHVAPPAQLAASGCGPGQAPRTGPGCHPLSTKRLPCALPLILQDKSALCVAANTAR